MINMDRNTSPVSPFTEEEFSKAYRTTAPHLYPEDEIFRFKENYSRINGFNPNEIELANGSDEWLQKLMITLGKGGVMTLTPDFVMYEVYAKQIGVPFYQVDSNVNFDFDFDRIAEEIIQRNPSLFILSNPHNPTGVLFTEEELEKISTAVQEANGYFVIDEAYVEFSADYQRPEGDHVILLRTMSKIYGMAGLRIGIIQAADEAYRRLTSINHPYPLNNLNLNLASEFLENEEKRAAFIAYQKDCRKNLLEAFDLVKDYVSVKPSASNFVFTYGKNARNLGLFLREKGYSGRFYDEENLKDAVRYSIIGLEDYPKFLEALKEWKETIGG